MQDAQKGRPARPQRVKIRGGTHRTLWGRSPLEWILANGKAPTVLPASEELLLNVEGLNDARTMHGKRRVSARRGWAGEKSDFFSILLSAGRCLSMFCRYPVQILWRLVRMAREPFLQYYIDRGDEKKREDCRDTESSNHRARQWGVRFPAGSPANGHREQSKNGGEGGHQNGPESRPRSGDRRVV